jgi:hypothetical protein
MFLQAYSHVRKKHTHTHIYTKKQEKKQRQFQIQTFNSYVDMALKNEGK